MRNPFAIPPHSTRSEHNIRVFIVLVLTIFLVFLFYYNIREFMAAKNRPLVESNVEVLKAFHVPGVLLCGPNLNENPKCHFGLVDGGKDTETECDENLWKKAPLTAFKYVYPDAVGEEWYLNSKDCFVFLPPDDMLFRPQVAEQLTVEIYSNETTTAAGRLDRWAYFGIFWPWVTENPRWTRVDFFNLPAKKTVSISRRTMHQADGTTLISYETATSRRMIPGGFRNDTHKWGVINLRPEYDSEKRGYVVTTYTEKPNFQICELLSLLGGGIALALVIYEILFGAFKLNLSGIAQTYVFHTADQRHPVFINAKDDSIMLDRVSTSKYSRPKGFPQHGFQQMGEGEEDAVQIQEPFNVSEMSLPALEQSEGSEVVGLDLAEQVVDNAIGIQSLKQQINAFESFLRRHLAL